MNVVGIVAEYNPFHNGHLYQINKIKEELNADYIIVVMSGNYVQRGTCAILPKQIRTEIALLSGVDAIFELPVNYATASAEYFAYGAVFLLDSLGIVNTICFGSECGDLNLIHSIATLLTTESPAYKTALLQYQKEGHTYPKARAMAVYDTMNHESYSKEEILSVMSSPNNILGIEYVKALIHLNSNIIPYTIKRNGADYHSLDSEQSLPSATALRNILLNQYDIAQISGISDISRHILQESQNQSFPIVMDDFSSLLYYKLSMETSSYTKYLDVSADLSQRIQKLCAPGITYSEYVRQLKTRQWTETRIWRSLLHILLDIRKEDISPTSPVMYIRLLGFVKKSAPLLRQLQDSARIPIITKVADAKRMLDSAAYSMLCSDIRASHLYQQIVFEKYSFQMKNEFTIGPVII